MKKSISVSMLTVGCSLLLATSGLATGQMSGQSEQQKDQQKQQYSQQDQQKQQQVGSQQQQQQEQNQYAQNLMTPDKLDGLKVQNQQGEQIGTVDKVVLDSEQGQVAYVVVTSGGFWGVGGDKAVIPWKAVKLQQQGQQQEQQGLQQQEGAPVLVLDANKEMLMNAPQGEIQETLDRQQAEQIHQYYGVSPYWEGQGQQQQQPGQQQKQQKQDMQQMHQDMMQQDKMQQDKMQQQRSSE